MKKMNKMKNTLKIPWVIKLSLLLVLLSVAIYAIKYLVIGDAGESNTLTYIFNALGFLPLNVLLVTLILNGLLSMRAKKAQQEKMKMIIGLFFSEFGSALLKIFVHSDSNRESFSTLLDVKKDWTKKDYLRAHEALATSCNRLTPTTADFCHMQELLSKNHDFLLRLVENPVFLEHEMMADLMQALFHLSEELEERGAMLLEPSSLPKTDFAHLTGDANRVYCMLASVWLSHIEYLSDNYPYLFSLSVRKSPFVDGADVVVRE